MLNITKIIFPMVSQIPNCESLSKIGINILYYQNQLTFYGRKLKRKKLKLQFKSLMKRYQTIIIYTVDRIFVLYSAIKRFKI